MSKLDEVEVASLLKVDCSEKTARKPTTTTRKANEAIIKQSTQELLGPSK